MKTLSTIIGHVSSATTLNVYAHVTGNMKKEAAAKIDQGIAKEEAPTDAPQAEVSHTMTDFKPQGGNADTGEGKRLLWSAKRRGPPLEREIHHKRYTIKWPDGRKETRNIYADTREECERLLAKMIAGMKAEVAAERRRSENEAKAS